MNQIAYAKSKDIKKQNHFTITTTVFRLLVMKFIKFKFVFQDFENHMCHISKSHFCITFDFEDESYICYAFWVPYEVYIKDFSKFHCFPPVLSS